MKRAPVIYWLIGIVIVAVIIAAAFYFDGAVRGFVVQHQNRTLHQIVLYVSRFGDWLEHFAIGVVLLGIAWWRKSQKWKRIVLAMLIALAVAGLLGRVIKITTGRARPSVKAEQLWTGPRLAGAKYQSFPSGHVIASSAFFVVLFLANRRVGAACLSVPSLIGFARIYLDAHWLSDVVCAAVLGILCALLVWRIAKGPVSEPHR